MLPFYPKQIYLINQMGSSISGVARGGGGGGGIVTASEKKCNTNYVCFSFQIEIWKKMMKISTNLELDQ